MREPTFSYAEEIRRTPCGAVDDYHYYKIGRRIRSEAFHGFMQRFWARLSGQVAGGKHHEELGTNLHSQPSH